jgi:hypothetical protein
MMLLDVVDRLLGIEAELVVTITAPLDRHRPGNDEDRIRIRQLVADSRKPAVTTRCPSCSPE